MIFQFSGIIIPLVFNIYVLSKIILSSYLERLDAHLKCFALQLQDLFSNFLEVVGAHTQSDVLLKMWVTPVGTTIQPAVFQFVDV